MTSTLLRLVALAAFGGTMVSSTAQETNTLPKTVADGAVLKKLSGEFRFTEGPTADAEGNVFFTDQPNDRIMKWSVDGRLSTFMQPSGRANGMHFDAKGNLIVCADETNALWSVTRDGAVTVIPNTYDGKRMNGPNDIWIRPDGGMYLTDPYYQRPWWEHKTRPQDGEHVYFLTSDRQKLVRVATDFVRPNGITGTADGKTLFVSDLGARKTYAFDIAADGSLANRRLFCESGSDGMTIDAEGNLYLTGRGVLVFDKEGKPAGTIPVPERWTANVSFGGKDHKTLFITASEGLYSIDMKVKGANAAK